ncbi:MAG TPA: acetyl-CoA carboxylase biotin carboxyl carrier protein [Amycolatopsis sp.]|uniref:acetyl-CoA carboxylase biotin carboxyl carrier protein n=1 Tax=Amycolatopsis sp. TaxID=37632 RepID=UPI002B47B77A|nr:acetyl-CoA carboxylase biotin carboxyl carrier protein [Amycolatopsis sp.]HKS49984.1 acetyl-CoA carboxylase biotin carboxyl carrier protein [Amycolatopsis sp.]
MSEPAEDDHAAILHALTQEVAAVAKLSGAVRRVAMQAAGHSVEVEWSDTEAQAVPARVPDQEPRLEERDDVVVVRAPLVGTFYTAPQPGAPPFVSVGETVEKGQTLAIVEAMKLMNPLLAECDGTVDEVLVGNGEPVEFDQPLMVVAKGDSGKGEGGP